MATSSKDEVVKLFNNLDKGSKSYLTDVWWYTREQPRRLQKIIKMRDKARSKNKLDKLPSQLNDKDKQLNLSVADSERHVKNDAVLRDINQIISSDNFVNRYDHSRDNKLFVAQISNKPFRARIGAENSKGKPTRKLNQSEMAVARAREHLSFEPNPTKTLSQAQSKDTLSAVDLGKRLYGRLNDVERGYFDLNMRFGKHDPQLLNRIKIAPLSQLGTTARRERDYLDDYANGRAFKKGKPDMLHHHEPLSAFQRRPIDNFFNTTGAMSALKDKSLASGINDVKDNERLHKYEKTATALSPEIRRTTLHDGMALYNGLSPQGKALFKENTLLANNHPDSFHNFKEADYGGLTKYQRYDYAQLYNIIHGIGRGRHGKSDVDSTKAVPQKDVDKVNEFFRKSAVPTISHDLTNRVHEYNLSHYENGDPMSAIKPDDNHAHSVKTNYKATDPQHYQQMVQSAGVLYNGLSPQGRRYLITASQEATKNLDDFNAVRNNKPGDLSYTQSRMQRNLQYASGWGKTDDGSEILLNPNLEDSRHKPVSRNEKSKIDKFLDNDVTQEGLGKNHDVYNRIISTANDKHIHSVHTNYKQNDPQRYNQMIQNAGDLYDNLSERGRRYLFTASQEATKNLDDFNAVKNNKPEDLSFKQAKMQKRLQDASGWGKTDDGSEIQLSPSLVNSKHASVERDEKAEIDKFLNNDVTQEGLGNNHDVYDYIVLRNQKIRQAQEEQQELDKIDDSPEKKRNHRIEHGSALSNMMRRRHPYTFALGNTLAGATDFGLKHGTSAVKRFGHHHKDFFKRSSDRIFKRAKSHKDDSPSKSRERDDGPTR